MHHMVDLDEAESALFFEYLKRSRGPWQASLNLGVSYPTLLKISRMARPRMSHRLFDVVMPQLRASVSDEPGVSESRCPCGEVLSPGEGGDCLLCLSLEQHVARYARRSPAAKKRLLAAVAGSLTVDG